MCIRARPLSTSAKAIPLIGGSSFEQAQFLFLSDVMNKCGLVMMQGKKDVPFWEAFQGAFRVYTIAALVTACITDVKSVTADASYPFPFNRTCNSV